MESVIAKKALPQWISKLSSYDVYAPVKKDDQWNYELVGDAGKLNLDFPTTVQSPKKLVLAQREVLLRFKTNTDGLVVEEVLPAAKTSVIFGVRPCDARAITLLDKVFGGDYDDPYYQARRKAAAIVGLACGTPPSPNCFCLSVDGSPFSKEGLDVLMVDLGDRYLVESLTPKGEELVRKGQELFSAATPKDKEAARALASESEKQIKRQVRGIKDVPAKLKQMWEAPLWEEESLRCIRCGICTYLCPTCHCFDMNDEVASSAPLRGERVRTWDNCQFPDFTMHSSGHNPRPDRASRLRQRILHKFQYFVERYQNYQCTGCGRCVTKCPVGIDIIEVLDKVSEYGG